tara:strand:+ start:1587 stop:2072 length:486 start_codon:yes stop_codon:yes gene_type:complete
MYVNYMKTIKERYLKLGYQPYRWFHAGEDPAPFTPLYKKIEECRVGLLSTSGAYSLGQSAYHYKDDSSLRSIEKNCSTENIRFSHITENYLENPRKDPNCILPLGQLLRMEKEGKIGELADQVFSCMGGIYSQRKVLEDIAPNVYSRFLSQEVDVALLVPM